MELDQLTLESAKALEGKHFDIMLPDGGQTRLVVDAVLPFERRQRRPTRGERQPKREPFSIYFLGPPTELIEQGMYDFQNPDAKLGQVFIVPIGQDAEATEYEAVFT
ncbi:MAG: hypothetical protein ABI411_01560 [Tahibacter sp.]